MDLNRKHEQIQKMNQYLFDKSLDYLPFLTNMPSGFSVHTSWSGNKNHAESVKFYTPHGEVIFTAVNGSTASQYMEFNPVKKEIMEIFSGITALEKKYSNQHNPDFQHEVSPLSLRLPSLYEKLGKIHWLIEEANNVKALESVLKVLSEKTPLDYQTHLKIKKNKLF